MTAEELASEIGDLLELDTDLNVSLTPYNSSGSEFIVDFNEDLTEGFLVTVERYGEDVPLPLEADA